MNRNGTWNELNLEFDSDYHIEYVTAFEKAAGFPFLWHQSLILKTFKVSTGVTKSKELSQEVSKSNEQTYSFPLKCKGGKTVQGIAK